MEYVATVAYQTAFRKYILVHIIYAIGTLINSLFLCRPSYTAVLCPWLFGGPIRALRDNAEPFFFCGLSYNLELTSLRFIHSFIPDIYIAPLQETYSETLSVQLRSKRNVKKLAERRHVVLR